MVDPADADSPGEAEIRWRCWPLVDGWPRSAGFVAAFGIASAAAGVAFGAVGYGLLAAGLLAVALGRYYLPTTYRLDDGGAAARFFGQTHRMPWPRVRRVLVYPDGVFLSPFERPSRLDSFRGMFLRFAGNGDEVRGFVRRSVQADLETAAP